MEMPGIQIVRNSDFGKALTVLSRADKIRVIFISVIQTIVGLLDLAGVLLIGILGALFVSNLQSITPDSKVSGLLELLRIENFSLQSQGVILGIASVVLLVGRTLFSILFTKRILYFFSRRGADTTEKLVQKLLSKPLLYVQARTIQETLFALTTGVSVIYMQVLATYMVLFADIALLIIMAIGLVVADIGTAIGTITIFGLVSAILFRQLHSRASVLGASSTELNIDSNEKIVEVLSSFRESVVRGRQSFYAKEIGSRRKLLAEAAAEISFLPYVSKYVIESSIILGAIGLTGAVFLLKDASHAVATMVIFLTSGARIAPALLRVQQSLIQIRGGIGMVEPTLTLIKELSLDSRIVEIERGLVTNHDGFVPELVLKDVSFNYPGSVDAAVQNINLTIPSGSVVAVIGASGAGKTTLIDLVLGILTPDSGSVSISGQSPQNAIKIWPGAIAYVPQDIALISGSIRENISLGYDSIYGSEELVSSSVKFANLSEFVAGLPSGFETQVGEKGNRLSGGQRQRLGIARAMFTNPSLLVLDEATSALDSESESAISGALEELRGRATVIVIAHRLATLRNADIVLYIERGQIISQGKFSDVKNELPNFTGEILG